MTDTPRIVTLQELHADTSEIIKHMCESGQPVVVTRHGRFLSLIKPIPDGIEAAAIAAYLEDNPLSDPT